MIVSITQDYGVYYCNDYMVLTRNKQPSKYHRKIMREKLFDLGFTAKDFDKGIVFECWGEDHFNV